MTTPQIIQVPGAGAEVAQGLAPLIQALQQNRQLADQHQFHQQELLAQLFAHGMQTPGFESTPAAKEIETRLDVPGLSKGVAQARNAEQKRRLTDIDEFVSGLPKISDNARAGLRASLAAGARGATSDVQKALFSAFAAGEDMTVLE